MKKSLIPALGALTVAATLSTVVLAQDMKPDRAIKYRQGILQAMGWNMGILGGMAKGDLPYNKDQAVRAATFVEQLAAMPWDGFVPGSDAGAPTKAKPEIWKDKAKFDKYAQDLQAETPKLLAAARTGDLAQLKAAVGPTGKACGNCHDDFRAK